MSNESLIEDQTEQALKRAINGIVALCGEIDLLAHNDDMEERKKFDAPAMNVLEDIKESMKLTKLSLKMSKRRVSYLLFDDMTICSISLCFRDYYWNDYANAWGSWSRKAKPSSVRHSS
jgi:hypothetical protein